MMGLEPPTFCMANAPDVRTSSRPFAKLHRCGILLQLSERDRTQANGEPCHSCHASFDAETTPPKLHPERIAQLELTAVRA